MIVFLFIRSYFRVIGTTITEKLKPSEELIFIADNKFIGGFSGIFVLNGRFNCFIERNLFNRCASNANTSFISLVSNYSCFFTNSISNCICYKNKPMIYGRNSQFLCSFSTFSSNIVENNQNNSSFIIIAGNTNDFIDINISKHDSLDNNCYGLAFRDIYLSLSMRRLIISNSKGNCGIHMIKTRAQDNIAYSLILNCTSKDCFLKEFQGSYTTLKFFSFINHIGNLTLSASQLQQCKIIES